MIVIESAGLSDVGKKRKENQDYMFLDSAMGLYVVADGMGGHQAGEVASRLVVETIRDYFKQFHNGGGNPELIHNDASLSREANQLLSGIHLSNQVVHKASLNNTLEVLLDDFGFDVAVGFKRLYRQERLVEVTEQVPGVVKAELWSFQAAELSLDEEEERQVFVRGVPADSVMFRPRIIRGRALLPGDDQAILLNNK